MATVSIKRIAAAVMISSALSFAPKLTFAESSDGMMAFDAQKIPTMGSLTNYSSGVKHHSAENKANSCSMAGEVKCSIIFHGFSLAFKSLTGQGRSSNKSVPKLNPRTSGAFPLDQQGELDNQVPLAEQYRKEKFILYKDIKMVKVVILLRVPNITRIQLWVQRDNVLRKMSPCMCRPLYGEGFTIGIEGMRVGGIRRIIVHKDLLKNLPKDLTANFKNYAVFDVELVDVCPSPSCSMKDRA